jgi:hypothetical protein
MNRETFEEFQKLVEQPEQSINITQFLFDKNDRTLLYGYTTDRYSFHVYIEDGEIVKHIYNTIQTLFVCRRAAHILSTLVPNKRVYPETCDADFCYLLRSHGIRIPFTTFNDDREPQKYYGEVSK